MTMAMMKTESPLARQTEAASCSQSQCGLLETEFFSYCASVLEQMCPKTRWDARDFFLSVCSPIPMSGVWFRRLRLNPPLARGHSKPIVEKYFVFVLVPNAAAEPSLGSRAFETNC